MSEGVTLPLPPPREPVFNIPPVIVVAIAGLAAIHIGREWIPDLWDLRLLSALAFVPARLTLHFDMQGVGEALLRVGDQDRNALAVARFWLGDGSAQPWTALSYGLLHGSWAHLGLNCLWMLAFGAPLARRLGSLRVSLFLALATLAGAIVHYLAHPFGFQPVIGASAAVSGCMGATLRFMFRPRSELPVVHPGGAAPRPAPPQPLQPLLQALRDRRVVSFIVIWFLTNLLVGLVPAVAGINTGSIAWLAHVGGFLTGLLLLPLFDPATRGAAPQR